VRFIVAQSPGRLPMVARWVADRLSQSISKPFVVENIQDPGIRRGADHAARRAGQLRLYSQAEA
jgi:hypothetical protein